MRIATSVFGISVALLAGCVSMGQEVTHDQLSSLKKGETTIEAAIAQLGPPSSSTVTSNGQRMISYVSMTSQARPATFIPIIGPLVGGADSRTSSTTLTFGPDGKLLDYQSTQSQFSSDMGIAAGGVQQPVTNQRRDEAKP